MAPGETPAPGEALVVNVAAGASHTLVLLSGALGGHGVEAGSTLLSMGLGEDGQLGHGDASDCTFPTVVLPLVGRRIKLVAGGAEHTVAASDDNVVYSFGWGDFGRLGHGDGRDYFLPTPVKSLAGLQVCSIACGDSHTILATADGSVLAFGRNAFGQLGTGNNRDALTPVPVAALRGHEVKMVACGAEHSAVVTAGGEVYTWGWNLYSPLGLGDAVDRHSPARVKGLLETQQALMVACGWRHTIVVTCLGANAAINNTGPARTPSLYTFGWNRYGQLGLGDNDDRSLPAAVTGPFAGARSVIARGGWRHTLALREDGTLWGWGWGRWGQTGLGATDDVNAPHQIFIGAPVVSMACGWRHSIAVSADGGVFTWGRGCSGQLGHGTIQGLAAPRRVAAIDILRAAAPEVHVTSVAVGQSPDCTAATPPAARYARVPSASALHGLTNLVPDAGESAGPLADTIAEQTAKAKRSKQ